MHPSLNSTATHPLRLISFFAALLFTCAAHAELKFERTVIEDVIAPDIKNYPFEFAFENTGESVVEISEIKTTCGCTTAELEKMTYAPGESGVIKGVFKVGNRQGKQDKKVRVLTKSSSQPEIKLSLKIDIPQLATMKPGLLVWRIGKEPDAKVLTIMPNQALGTKILSVECESPDFAVESLPSDGSSGKFEVIVAPMDTDSTSRGLIKVTVSNHDSEKSKTIFAHALVR